MWMLMKWVGLWALVGVVGLFLLVGLGLLGMGVLLPSTEADSTGVVTDVVDWNPSGHFYTYEIEFDHDGETQRSNGYEGDEFDVGDVVPILFGPDGVESMNPDQSRETQRFMGVVMIVLGLIFLWLGIMARRTPRPADSPPLVERLAFATLGIVGLAAIFAASAWNYQRLGPSEDAVIVAAEVLGARSGVELTVQLESGVTSVTTIGFREWLEGPDAVTVYPNTDPLLARSELNDVSAWQVWAWIAVAVGLWSLVVRKFLDGRETSSETDSRFSEASQVPIP